MKYLKDRDFHLLEKNLNESIDHLLNEDIMLLERGRSYNDNESSLLGKAVKSVFGFLGKSAVSLLSPLTDKIKDVIGIKSNILKNLLAKLDQAIEKLPEEYIEKNEEVNNVSLMLDFYTALKAMTDFIAKEDVYKKTEFISKLNEYIISYQDISKSIVSNTEDAKNFLKTLEEFIASTKELIQDAENDKGVDINGIINIETKNYLNDKNIRYDINKNLETLKLKFSNIVKTSRDRSGMNMDNDSHNVKGATRSVYEIIAITNRAVDIFTTEEKDEEDDRYSKSKNDINKRLFKIWEKGILGILAKKGTVIPKPIQKYINSSLTSNFVKYKGSDRDQSILDELADIDTAINKTKALSRTTRKNTNVDLFNAGKPNSDKMYFKEVENINITYKDYMNAVIVLECRTVRMQSKEFRMNNETVNNVAIALIPVSFKTGLFISVLLFNESGLVDLTTNTANKKSFDADLLDSIKSSFIQGSLKTINNSFYYIAIEGKILTKGHTISGKIYNPSSKIKDVVDVKDKDFLFRADISKINVLTSEDSKIVSIAASDMASTFDINTINFKELEKHYSSGNIDI
jgi:hypothetical protein